MIFEICNNIAENLFMSSFIAQYIHFKENKVKFILITTLLNALISTVLTQLQIVGFTQTLAIQLILWIGLYVFHKNFSWQDIMVSLYSNILLFFSVYFGYLILSLLFHIKPYDVFINQVPYITVVFFSKSIYIALLIYSLKKRPLLFTNTKINRLKHLFSFELLMIMLMAYYFTSYVLSVEFSHRSNIMFLCFIFLFISFCFIVNQFISMNQEILNNKLKEKEQKYEKANLTNIKNIKYYLENTEHRLNYIIQSLEYDLKQKNYEDALKKVEMSKDLIYKIPTVICTSNEIFDFMINLEIKQLREANKDIKVCAFLSKNHVYNNNDIINHILDPLKFISSYTDSIELFLTENQSHTLEIRYLISKPSRDLQDHLDDFISNQYIIKENENMIILQLEIDLDEYFY